MIGQKSTGVLLIGHGTRNESGTAEFFRLRDELAAQMPSTPVQAALLEFQEPSIDAGWSMLVEQGVEHVHVAPLLLFAAGHAKQDIPSAIKESQKQTPEITYDQCRPLSRHSGILELVMSRVESCVAQLDTARERTALVMVGRGSYDPCARSDMLILSHLIEHRSHFGCVRTAFYAMSEPKLPDILEEIANQDLFDAVVIQPHLLFEGRLYQAIAKQVENASEKHPNLKWKISNYLGPHHQVARAIQTRISQVSKA